MNEKREEALLRDVWEGQAHIVWSLPDGGLQKELDVKPKGVLSGSFNPLHEGHKLLRDAAEQWLQGPVCYEISITNAEKHPLDFQTISQRRLQFEDHPLALTDAPTFVEKVSFLRKVIFVVGADTAERIVQPCFYHGETRLMHKALETIRSAGCSFLVAGRKQDQEFLTLSEVPIPSDFNDLFEELPESVFRQDISSTEHRREPGS